MSDHHQQIAELMSLLDQQLELYRQLQRLAEKQRGLLRREDPQPLLSVMAERQAVVDRLAELKDRLDPIREDWEALRSSLSPAERGRAETTLAEVRQILASVLHSDERDSRTLAVRMAQSARHMQSVGASRRALEAYRSQTQRQTPSVPARDRSA